MSSFPLVSKDRAIDTALRFDEQVMFQETERWVGRGVCLIAKETDLLEALILNASQA